MRTPYGDECPVASIFLSMDTADAPSAGGLTLTLTPRQLAARKGHITRKLRRRLWQKVKAFWTRGRRWRVGRVVISIKEGRA